MLLDQLGRAVLVASLVIACGHPPKPPKPPNPATAAAPEYKLIRPDVSSNPPAVAARDPVPIGEHEDVMANILAIPPGR